MFLNIIKFVCFFILMHTRKCESESVIYRINDSEYRSLPTLFTLDEYDSCLEELGGVYCVAKFQLFSDDRDNQLMRKIKEYSKFTPKHYDHSYLDRGICITNTCPQFTQNKSILYGLNETRDLEHLLVKCVNKTTWNIYKLQIKLIRLFYCDKSGDVKRLDMFDHLVAAIFMVILVLNLTGSFYHVVMKNIRQNEKYEGNAHILSFSIIKNYQFLISKSDDPKLKRLKGFYGLKTLAAVGVAVAHSINPLANGFVDNPHAFEQTYDEVKYQVLYNGLMTVQMFFAISGFLMVYSFKMKSTDASLKWSMFPKICFLRWWRLTPPFAMTLMFSATWLRLLGSGPLWNLYVKSPADDCKNYWWQFLLYFNNYSTGGRFCSFQTWSLAADFQLTILGVFLYLATRRRGRKLMLCLFLLLGCLLPVVHVYLQDLDGAMMLTPDETFFTVYITGHNNLPAFMIGMTTGLMVYRLQQQKVNFSNYKVLSFLLWLVIPVTLMFFYSGSVFFTEGQRAALATRAVYAALQRPVMGMLVAYVIFGLVMGISPSFSRLLEWDGWIVPGRLSYSLFLLHVIFIQMISGSKVKLAHFYFQNLIINQIAVVVMSYLAAVPLYLLIEAPSVALMKVLTQTKKTDQIVVAHNQV